MIKWIFITYILVCFRYINVFVPPLKFPCISYTHYSLCKAYLRAEHIWKLAMTWFLLPPSTSVRPGSLCHLSLPLLSPPCTQRPHAFTSKWTSLFHRWKLLIHTFRQNDKVTCNHSQIRFPFPYIPFPPKHNEDFFPFSVALPSPLCGLCCQPPSEVMSFLALCLYAT